LLFCIGGAAIFLALLSEALWIAMPTQRASEIDQLLPHQWVPA
jgi:hypothetical protein